MIDRINPLWVFKGTKGQMFLSTLVYTDNLAECDQEFKAAIAVPASEAIASSQIKSFASYVKRIGDQRVASGGNESVQPNMNSAPFLLSYFWHIQERDVWPFYYRHAIDIMTDLELWCPSGHLAADYLAYKHVHETLTAAFTKESGEYLEPHKVDHLFWFTPRGWIPGLST